MMQTMTQQPAPAQSEQPEGALSQMEVLIRLHVGAIDFLNKSMTACDEGNIDDFKGLLERSRKIIEEFQRTLDFKRGGQISTHLNSLYEFMLSSLSQAELTHDTLFIQRVVRQLETLLDGWRGAQLSANA
ncbi:MAG: flagellar protein FliS [Magnetococcales bacterium]|nr:flagellar protein FliS [Magnetococcales bacterium]